MAHPNKRATTYRAIDLADTQDPLVREEEERFEKAVAEKPDVTKTLTNLYTTLQYNSHVLASQSKRSVPMERKELAMFRTLVESLRSLHRVDLEEEKRRDGIAEMKTDEELIAELIEIIPEGVVKKLMEK